ncbi:MAG TPA: response regulator transcription factor [Patescibacteria group bacterium]|nr:response regulator transcription factor [Patescibacteria group bacterium]
MKALLIEDDKVITNSLISFLKEKNIILDSAIDGGLGLMMAQTINYDIIILDYNLPTLNGWEITKKLRSQKINTPIIMVTVRSELDDKLKLLEEGVDDYLTKPFSLCELLARIKAVTRRPAEIKEKFLKVSDLKLYPDKFIVKRGTKNLKLKAKEFSLLEYLMINQGAYVSRQDIMEHVWDENADPFSNTIEVHIMKLRKKIDDQKNKFIYTMPNRGYKIDIEE